MLSTESVAPHGSSIEEGGVVGRAALGMSDSDESEDEEDGDDNGEVQEAVAPCTKRKRGCHLRPWQTVEVGGAMCSFIVLRDPVLMMHLTSEAVAAVCVAIHHAKEALRAGSTSVSAPGTIGSDCKLSELRIDLDEGRWTYAAHIRKFTVMYTTASGERRTEKMPKLPRANYDGTRFTATQWRSIVQGFIVQCRMLWNRKDNSDAQRYSI